MDVKQEILEVIVDMTETLGAMSKRLDALERHQRDRSPVYDSEQTRIKRRGPLRMRPGGGYIGPSCPDMYDPFD